MKKIFNKEEMQECLRNGESHFYVGGDFANELLKLSKKVETKKKVAKGIGIGSLILTVACIAAIPFTGGASGVGAVAAVTNGLTATLASGTVISLTTGEVAILCGTALAGIGIATYGYGDVIVTKTENGVEVNAKRN